MKPVGDGQRPRHGARHPDPRVSMIVRGDLPIEDLAILAVRESRRPRAVYQTHKWFARRFGSAFRGLLIACVLEPDADFWSAYLGDASLEGRVVVDPFVGGGTAIGEAQRLGATCLALDVDPVAVSITRFQSKLGTLPDLRATIADLHARVGTDLSQYHETEDEEGSRKTVLHHFFVQSVTCAACGAKGRAHPHHQLAYDGARQWVFCRSCDCVHEIAAHDDRFSCEACETDTVVGSATTKYGVYTCAECGVRERLIDVAARTGSPPVFELFAIEYLKEREGAKAVPMCRRTFKAATQKDLALFEAASLRLRKEGHDAKLPRRIIPIAGRVDDRLPRYGYRTYLDLFNDRQRLHLAMLGDAIAEYDGDTRDAMAIAYCDHLKSNCMLTSYAFGWRRLAPLFSIRAFRHVTRPVEINPWLCGTGRGTFPNAVNSIRRAQAWLADPRESDPLGGFAPAATKRPHTGTVTTSIGSADRLSHIGDSSVDLVVTDPPYFDNIAYSELSDFFRPWHAAFGLTEDGEEGFPKDRLRATRGDDASAAGFRHRLASCFAEIARVLKRQGLLVFTYQHKTAAGWNALGTALAQAELQTVRVFPMLGDTDAGPHKHAGSIRWDAVIVARRSRRAAEATSLTAAAKAWASKSSREWIDRLSDNAAFPFGKADAVNLTMACMAAALAHGTNDRVAARAYDLHDLLNSPDQHGGHVDATALEEGAFAVRQDAMRSPTAVEPLP